MLEQALQMLDHLKRQLASWTKDEGEERTADGRLWCGRAKEVR
jgi:hypothetical protein